MRKLEENTDDLGFKFQIIDASSTLHEDSWEEGELDFYTSYSNLYGLNDSIYTLDELMKELKANDWNIDPKFYIFTADSEHDDHIESDRTVTEDDEIPTKEEFAKWEKGKMKLYNEHLYISISVIRGNDNLTDSDLKALDAKGFQTEEW